MPVASIENRVAALEGEVARFKQQVSAVTKPSGPWWEEIRGAFENDPIYEDAMRRGREYRESSSKSAKTANETINQTN